jgi:hypothetical protein|eukprot:COSAG01_NODE_1198_length_11294_cov_16.374632_7_plen_108_part_00
MPLYTVQWPLGPVLTLPRALVVGDPPWVVGNYGIHRLHAAHLKVMAVPRSSRQMLAGRTFTSPVTQGRPPLPLPVGRSSLAHTGPARNSFSGLCWRHLGMHAEKCRC